MISAKKARETIEELKEARRKKEEELIEEKINEAVKKGYNHCFIEGNFLNETINTLICFDYSIDYRDEFMLFIGW